MSNWFSSPLLYWNNALHLSLVVGGGGALADEGGGGALLRRADP